MLAVPPELLSPSAAWYPLAGAGAVPEGSLALGRQSPTPAWGARGGRHGHGLSPAGPVSSGMCFAGAFMTHLLILCQEIPVQSPVSSLPIPNFMAGFCETVVEVIPRGLGLAVSGVEHSLGVLQSGCSTLGLSYGGRCPTAFPYTVFYLQNNLIWKHIGRHLHVSVYRHH